MNAAKGHFENPMTEEDLVKKFKECAQRVLPLQNINKLCSRIEKIERIRDFKEFMALMRA